MRGESEARGGGEGLKEERETEEAGSSPLILSSPLLPCPLSAPPPPLFSDVCSVRWRSV